MEEYSRKQLSQYRMEKGEEDLATARHDYSAGHFDACINRTYYAIFHAMRAVLILDGLDFKKHSAVIGSFRKLYLKTEIIDSKFSSVIGEASNLRGKSDYDDFFLSEAEDAEEQIKNATEFYSTVQSYLEERLPDYTCNFPPKDEDPMEL